MNGHGGEQSDSGDELTIDVLRAEVRSLTELIRETQARLELAERKRDALARGLASLLRLAWLAGRRFETEESPEDPAAAMQSDVQIILAASTGKEAP